MRKIAILASHPVYYQAPLWKRIFEEPLVSSMVFFESKIGVGADYDPEFGQVIDWKLPVLEGYKYAFIKSRISFLGSLSEFDLLFVNAWSSPLIWVAVIWAKMQGVKVAIRAENPWNQEASKKGIKAALRRILLGGLFKIIDIFFYIGEENKKFYIQYGVSKNKLFFTPYAVDNEKLAAEALRLSPQRASLRGALGISPDAVVFLNVGKLIPKKRQFDILRAYEKSRLPGKALIFVGEGELRPKLEEYVKKNNIKNVIFTGFVGQEKIGEFYSIADVFILSSGQGETWGLVLNEALCFGLPAIVSDMVGSAKDLIHPEENGFLFPMGNIEVLSERMEVLGEHSGLRRSFGDRSREIIKNYSFETDLEGIRDALI